MKRLGFYRVDYDADNWNALINQLDINHSIIHVLNRAQIINDAFNLALDKRMDYTLVLSLSEYLKKEHDVLPWYSAKYEFGYLINRMRRCPNGYKYLKVINNNCCNNQQLIKIKITFKTIFRFI